MLVLLSILDPHLELPSEIDYCKPDKVILNSSSPHAPCGESSLKSSGPDNGDGMTDVPGKVDILEDVSLFFAPEALRNLTLVNSLQSVMNCFPSSHLDPKYNNKHITREEKGTQVQKSASGFSMKSFSLHLDRTQLLDYEICKSRASDFRRLALDLHSQKSADLEGHNAAIDAMILSAECYINPFLISVKGRSENSDQVNLHGTKYPRDQEISELRKALGKGNCNLETISHLERKRDKVFVQTLLEAAEMDRIFYQKVSDGNQCPYGAVSDEELERLSDIDVASFDAITLVRRNQDLLCNFLIHQLQREQQSLHETIMQALVFLLHCATKLVCPPESVIDIILGSAENLNRFLMSTLHQYKEGKLQLSPERIYRIQRHWTILQSLIIASSGGSSVSNNVFNVSGCQYSNLIPPSTWICKIPTFSLCAFPLVRYLGWMAVSRNAKGYVTQRLFLASNLSQLTNLLFVFADDLAVMDFDGDNKKEVLSLEELEGKQDSNMADKFSQEQYQCQSFAVKYPDLSILFPGMQKEFKTFRETILEAVSLQLRSLASTSVPDILDWFSEFCMSPFLGKTDKGHDSFPLVKGYQAKNAKAIILYILEAIISEHMEAVIPEMPRLVQVLGSLCSSSYCDAPFLRSILRLLKPIISYSLCKNFNEEKHLNADSCLDFESLCFDELFSYIGQERKNIDSSTKRVKIALVIFILASVFKDLSFDRKREVIQSSVRWVDFPAFEPTSAFYDYLCSFEQLLQSCNDFLVENLRVHGLIPMPQAANINFQSLGNNGSESYTWFPDDFCYGCEKEDIEKSKSDNNASSVVCTDAHHLSSKGVGAFGDIDSLVSKLNITIESSWNLHPQLSRSLAICSAKCLMYSRCLSSIIHETSNLEGHANDNSLICETFDEFFSHWKNGIEGLAEKITLVQAKSCWEVTSTMVECLMKVPAFCSLDNVAATLSSVIEHIMFSAPKISWRMQTDRWLKNLFSRGILMHESGICLIELISKMLNHSEPELRFTALLHLGRLFGLDVNGGWVVLTSPSFDKLTSQDNVVCISESVLSQLVSKTWDQVALMASADASLHLRTVAMALLVHFIPFADRAKLQSFLENADSLIQALENFAYPMGEGLFAQLSLALISGACLYCPAEDMMLIPQHVWRYVETLGGSTTGRVGEMEKRICQALCKVKHQEEEAKEALKEALSSCSSKQFDPEFGNTRESVLQVLANLTSVQSYFDMFAEKMDQEARELEEAELEMEILQKEVPTLEDNHLNEAAFPSDTKDGQRLQQIKDGIRSLEKSRIKEDIIERRKKKLSLRHRRQKYLEEVALQEAKLLEELDRQRTSEVEKEIERQRMLELERAKTNELRYNLDLEKEKQTQREIQRELEQVESGSRPSRREFSSTHSSGRPRDRYRDRENGRSNADGSLRTGTTSLPPDMPVNSQSLVTTPTVVLSGSRTFSVQPPTILQARDRVDECNSSYEENLDGSKDSGDTGSTGDPELGSGFDGLTGGFGSSQRHGSRGSKSRQILERRERDGRREGKWERKH
ncbi:30S ribosomal protein S14 [Bienertia sinuspersici]